MDTSIFMDKTKVPSNEELAFHLNLNHEYWRMIHDFVFEKYPKAIDEWKHSGIKHGWHFRIKDKKRVIIYLLPREGYFKVAFVFGQKASDKILVNEISEFIKTELRNAKVYVEGRGIRLDITDSLLLNDIKKLIEIKLAN